MTARIASSKKTLLAFTIAFAAAFLLGVGGLTSCANSGGGANSTSSSSSDAAQQQSDSSATSTPDPQEALGSSELAYNYPFEDYNADPPAMGAEDLRTAEETPIGTLVTTAYLDKTGADAAIENAGGIRDGIPQGTVTYGAVAAVLPMGNSLETRELTGAQLKEIWEESLDIQKVFRDIFQQQKDWLAEDPERTADAAIQEFPWPNGSGSVLIFGGMKADINWDADKGSRIADITMGDGSALDPGKTYVVAMSSYIPTMQEAYPQFAETSQKAEWGTCEAALSEYIASHSPLNAA